MTLNIYYILPIVCLILYGLLTMVSITELCNIVSTTEQNGKWFGIFTILFAILCMLLQVVSMMKYNCYTDEYKEKNKNKTLPSLHISLAPIYLIFGLLFAMGLILWIISWFN